MRTALTTRRPARPTSISTTARPEALDLGDGWTETDLLTRARDGRQVGRGAATCTILIVDLGEPALEQCVGAADVPGDSLMFCCLLRRPRSTPAAIGGTGSYRHARGTLTLGTLDEHHTRWTFVLARCPSHRTDDKRTPAVLTRPEHAPRAPRLRIAREDNEQVSPRAPGSRSLRTTSGSRVVAGPLPRLVTRPGHPYLAESPNAVVSAGGLRAHL